MKLTEHHKAAIIGFWRMGTNERIIADIIGCDAIDVLYVIRNYEVAFKQKLLFTIKINNDED